MAHGKIQPVELWGFGSILVAGSLGSRRFCQNRGQLVAPTGEVVTATAAQATLKAACSQHSIKMASHSPQTIVNPSFKWF